MTPVAREHHRAASAEPAFVTRIRLRARRHILWLRHLWANTQSHLGLAISHEEVDRILAIPGRSHADADFFASDPDARSLANAIADADQALAADPRLTILVRTFALTPAELDLLTLAVAVEADPWLRRVFGYIHDDATSVLPTPWLARQLFQWSSTTRMHADLPLVRWRLARPGDGQPAPWSSTAAWMADSAIVAWLLDGNVVDPTLGTATSLVVPNKVPACIYPEQLTALRDFIAALDDAEAPIEVVIHAPIGAGKRTLATQLAAESETPLLVVDAGALLGAADPIGAREVVMRVHRSARLAQAAVYWDNADHAPPYAFASPVRLSMFGVSGPAPVPAHPTALRRTVSLPPLTKTARIALWRHYSSTKAPALVAESPLLPADIVRAAAVAPAGAEAIADVCRGTDQLDASGTAYRLPLPYQWADLVLPEATREHLEEFAGQIRLRWNVYEQWGFGRLSPLGRGISALFAGASGTGKTMAAQVIARELGMELYRIDLASVVNKYIGETEKNLRRVFDACERANALLFFDEADALFGQRMQTRDAHDRFANIEIDYLLQRMEQFDGVAVLATNRRSEIDAAFVRRLRFIVDFQTPGPDERLEMWTRALPKHASDGTELLARIDHRALADKLNLTGADIKNAALNAAFLARAENKKISMNHVIRAARRELAKQGVVLRGVELEG